MTDKLDGFRFRFVIGYPNERITTMEDELGEFSPVEMPSKLAEVLAKILAEQHTLRTEKTNRFARFNAFMELVKENSDVDKDILIACINASVDLID